MNSTDSEFWGYVKDKYTTLPEAHDRILATEVSAAGASTGPTTSGTCPTGRSPTGR